MNKELLDEIHNLVKELKEKLVDLEVEESDRNAPDRVELDPTSEDHYGMFVVARSGQFGNHTVAYVREDLVNCDYYESYIQEKIKNETLRNYLEDIFAAYRIEDETETNLHDVIKTVHRKIYNYGAE